VDERREIVSNEAEVGLKFIDSELHAAGLSENLIQRELRIAEEKIKKITDEFGNRKKALRPDYILWQTILITEYTPQFLKALYSIVSWLRNPIEQLL
jgi:hypothetical protein